jgi:hypothetical protein
MLILQYTQNEQTYEQAQILFPTSLRTGTFAAPR